VRHIDTIHERLPHAMRRNAMRIFASESFRSSLEKETIYRPALENAYQFDGLYDRIYIER
jgi:hypothetical protein